MENGTVRIVIADDHELLRSSLRSLLSTEHWLEVVAEASNGSEAVTLVETLRPDVAILDFSMPILDGIEATRIITTEFPGTRVVLLTMYDVGMYSERACAAGASAYLMKGCGKADVLDAILSCTPLIAA